MPILDKKNLIFLALGAFLMFIYHWNWVKTNETNTSKLIKNFKETYETQRGITESYEAILQKLSYCSASPDDYSCSFDEVYNLAKDSTEIRNKLIDRLEILNKETEVIMVKFPQSTQ